MFGSLTSHTLAPTSVEHVWTALRRFHHVYVPSGDVPVLEDKLDGDLFNTYRAALFPSHYPTVLHPHKDMRGTLVETVRAHGAGGQTFVSTTLPGVTRGDHFHLSKFERFVVLEGSAVIRLRRLFTSEIFEFEVSGDDPVAIDMPTMWLHNITNVGSTVLTTMFWTDALFDPANPDTFYEPVVTLPEEPSR
jgi:UDP-2-acetamido-2,6-beta-L-arabino-hexul-4-ose reductase